uniref:Uncharacterized protein n=1 Tax=Arundo donax TaxID=35708 RepID=A0A0A8XXW3_ARUDO
MLFIDCSQWHYVLYTSNIQFKTHG